MTAHKMCKRWFSRVTIYGERFNVLGLQRIANDIGILVNFLLNGGITAANVSQRFFGEQI
jgi:hypothetical protein